ncbi:hypothetical protein SERLADRAFT_416696 [Serpula lacrymans var. lacrymans S7.9]|uniref:Zinc/iron permease n=1 Tax=Serpula lacrymans var. lacrymans (strain S7.9) TaxID=578457 RepID=F8P2G1_SERL9|nr:uncharacterized protein SERLADRAFT_416696 [Serpula lacrymans var. lacrymans S7.9]EGO23339.1 hypothetical protein SERLADRAFT_416696 [Serpula lacrymans var. lacrymans S7.9]
MIHSIVIGLTLAVTTGSEFTSLLTAIIFHQLFEGLSLGIRIASLPSQSDSPDEEQGGAEGGKKKGSGMWMSFLKPTLAFLFAVTNPVGIVIGILPTNDALTPLPSSPSTPQTAHTKLIQGLMSAISSGMLIYAACVEMLAGDFVMDQLLWRSGVWKQALAVVSLLVGVAGMSMVG